MNILVISDTHGNVNRAFTAVERSHPIDLILHMGDGSADADLLRSALDIPVINVAGNCDPDSAAPREYLCQCEGKRVLMTHGDAYQVKSGLARLRQRGHEVGADGVFYGHTHVAHLEKSSGMIVLNPGTLANHAQYRSYALVVVTPEEIVCHHYEID